MSQQNLVTGYVPKLSLSIIGTACFGALAVIFWLRFLLQGKHRYMLTICISMTTMSIGFAIRIAMTNNPYSLTIYILTELFTLLSPCGFLAQDYMILPRLAAFLDADKALFIRSRLIVRVLVTSDIITFLLQASGGGLTAMSNPNTANLGHWIALIGLIIQCISFGIFVIMTIIFGFRVRRQHEKIAMTHRSATEIGPSNEGGKDSYQQYQPQPVLESNRWKVLYYALLWTCVGIMIRCVFRVIEYAQGYQGTLRTTEVYFYVLDSLPLFLATIVWVFVWPPRYLI